jgi:hypothetical protein
MVRRCCGEAHATISTCQAPAGYQRQADAACRARDDADANTLSLFPARQAPARSAVVKRRERGAIVDAGPRSAHSSARASGDAVIWPTTSSPS